MLSQLLPFSSMRINEGDARAVAGDFAALLRAERFAETVELFAPPLRAAVSEEVLRIAWTGAIAGSGEVATLGGR